MKGFIAFLLVLIIGLFAFASFNNSTTIDSSLPVYSDNPLIGEWSWDLDDSFFMEFNDDGTGLRNWNGYETFIWWTVGDLLRINIVGGYEEAQAYLATHNLSMIFNEHWTFTIADDNTLVIDSRQEQGMRFTYHKANEMPEPILPSNPLIGEWRWNILEDYVVHFNYDGTGRRGWEGEVEYFNWWTVDDLLRINLTQTPL